MPRGVRLRRIPSLTFIALVLMVAMGPTFGGSVAFAQQGGALSCEPLGAAGATPIASPTQEAGTPVAPALVPADATKVRVGFVPIAIYAPVFVALEKGYYAEQGLDVTLEPFAGGPEPITLTATGKLDFAAVGAGPAFWNAVSTGLPITVVAPGHGEGSPVATPLMISRQACESGDIASVADLKGKKVSVNARGATEYWLGQALATAGLSIDDIELQVLPFPDAVAALGAGAVDAAMVGEPLATRAELEGIAVRLLADFPVQGIQPTAIVGNSDFVVDNPDVATGFVTAYLQACRDLTAGGYNDPAILAIIEEYTGVAASLAARAVKPVCFPNGEINAEGLRSLQTFFRGRGQLEYDEDIDPVTFIDTQYVDAALERLGPVEA